MSSAPPCAVAFERELMDDQIDWSTQLRPWLDVFPTGSATLGLVTDWRPDGSEFTRQGVVVKLDVDLTSAMSGQPGEFEKIREAIDLALLILAVKPSVIKSVLLRTAGNEETKPPSTFADELAAMARGVPSELRLKFHFRTQDIRLLKLHFLDLLRLDSLTPASETFMSCREQLLDLLFQRPETLKRVARSALHSFVDAKLVIFRDEGATEAESEDFFTDLVVFLEMLASCQDREKDTDDRRSIITKHVNVRIKKAVLQVRGMHVTPRIAETAKSLVGAGVPVVLARLNIQCDLISCSQEELNAFVEAITANSRKVFVETNFSESAEDTDLDGQDTRDRIDMVFKALGRVRNIYEVRVGELLLLLSSTSLGREAVWRGLFEDVLSRDEPLSCLTLNRTVLVEQDGLYIRECVARWRQANSGKTLRVRKLHLEFYDSHRDGEHALLSAFDDMEKLSIHYFGIAAFLGSEHLAHVLQCPSLRSLSLTSAGIQTMDIFDRSIPDLTVPTKPKLQHLRLNRLFLGNPGSMSRFLQQLKPSSGSELSTTLRILHAILQPHCHIGDKIHVLEEVLSTNRTLRHVTLNSSNQEAVSAFNRPLAPHRDCVLPYKDNAKQLKLAKARNVAFLSTMQVHETRGDGAAVSACSQLASDVLSRIFAFAAPHVVRKVNVTYQRPPTRLR